MFYTSDLNSAANLTFFVIMTHRNSKVTHFFNFFLYLIEY